MNLVGKFDRLNRLGPDAEKVPRCVAETRMRGGESGRTPSSRGVWIRRAAGIAINVGLLHTSHRSRDDHDQRDGPRAPTVCSETRLHCSRKKSAQILSI